MVLHGTDNLYGDYGGLGLVKRSELHLYEVFDFHKMPLFLKRIQIVRDRRQLPHLTEYLELFPYLVHSILNFDCYIVSVFHAYTLLSIVSQ
ncbi:hypothetical protein D3C81_1699150 [compost metagenome]